MLTLLAFAAAVTIACAGGFIAGYVTCKRWADECIREDITEGRIVCRGGVYRPRVGVRVID
jgi:hypothetical protein